MSVLCTDSFRLQLPEDWQFPIVIDSPHSGVKFPTEYALDVDQKKLAIWVDSNVNDLYAFGPQKGVPLLEAQISRCFLDLNRHRFDVDGRLLSNDKRVVLKEAERTKNTGNGLLKRFGPNGEPLFDIQLDKAKLLELLAKYYHPYYGVLGDLMFQSYEKFGRVIHLNCHAMLPVNKKTGEVRPDIVISNNNGMTASSKMTDLLVQSFEKAGFSVALNHPFLGGEIVRYFGDPNHHKHSIQIEINKTLYLDMETFEVIPKQFAATQKKLQKAIGQFSKKI